MQALLEEGSADLSKAPQWIRQGSIPHRAGSQLRISWQIAASTPEGRPSTPDHLVYTPRHRLAVGLGCERDCPPVYIDDLLKQAKERLGGNLGLLHFASINLKVDEPAFLSIAPQMRFFPAADLAQIDVPNPSEIVQAEVGTPSVAEASALALAGDGAELVLPKIKNTKATLAVALAPDPIDMTRGQARPHLSILGLGPGDANLVSDQARNALEDAVIWVGYSLYLDQAQDMLGDGTPRLDFNLGDEEARLPCRPRRGG